MNPCATNIYFPHFSWPRSSALTGCKDSAHNGAASQPLPVAEVRVITVAGQAALQQNEVAGAVESVQRATIGAQISGSIEEIPVSLGLAVKKGALLARISAGEIAARLSQAETQLAQAQRNFEREKRLLEKDASTRETVNSLEDAYRVAEAGVREAKAMRDYTVITAPFAGIVTQKMANAGDLATPGMPLLVLENTEHLQVVAAAPEGLALKIKKGDTLAVTIPSAEFANTGTVTEISPAADTASRTALVKIRIAGGSALQPGQYARVALPGAAGVNTFLVPETALSALRPDGTALCNPKQQSPFAPGAQRRTPGRPGGDPCRPQWRRAGRGPRRRTAC